MFQTSCAVVQLLSCVRVYGTRPVIAHPKGATHVSNVITCWHSELGYNTSDW